jgi:hypothetical protein
MIVPTVSTNCCPVSRTAAPLRRIVGQKSTALTKQYFGLHNDQYTWFHWSGLPDGVLDNELYAFKGLPALRPFYFPPPSTFYRSFWDWFTSSKWSHRSASTQSSDTRPVGPHCNLSPIEKLAKIKRVPTSKSLAPAGSFHYTCASLEARSHWETGLPDNFATFGSTSPTIP